MWYSYQPYVSVAQRRADALKEIARRRKRGETITPIEIAGRAIASTFWGKSWCDNLEAYSDFESRLPRGRRYVRNGSVIHLQIHPGRVTALVSGSEIYEVEIKIDKLPRNIWTSVKNQCAGKIGSVIELVQGKLSKHVMDVVTRRPDGLFPKPDHIQMKCSCPDWATMCKHVAAVLYGVGARLDSEPELLFRLRQVDHLELIQSAGDLSRLATQSAAPTLAEEDLSEVFGIELADSQTAARPVPPGKRTSAVKQPAKSKRKKTAKKPAAKKVAARPVKLGRPSAQKPRPVRVRRSATARD